MIYFISDGNTFIKIGYTVNDVMSRLSSLQVGNPKELKIEMVIEGSEADEKALHDRFASYRYRGEWFYFVQEIKGYMMGEGKPVNKECVMVYRKYTEYLDKARE